MTSALCRDRFEGYPESILPGRQCDLVVPGPGWACAEHTAAFYAVMATPIADVPDEREAKARREAEAMDPAVVSLIAEARAYLTECEARPVADDFTVGGNSDFIAALLADKKYGTKWFRITENMALAIIRTRDGERARQAEAAATQPRKDEAIAWVQDNAPRNDFAGSLLGALRKWGRLTDRQYEAVLKNLDRTPTALAPYGDRTTTVQADGWYKVGDDIFKVQKAVHGSGNLYAKRLVVTSHGKASWEYAPGMVRTLTDEQRLSVEDAAEFGRLYGICACCAAPLTDEESIARGLGPICAKKL